MTGDDKKRQFVIAWLDAMVEHGLLKRDGAGGIHMPVVCI
jgi:hypothetical protein